MELLKRKSQMKRERKRETRNGKESGFEKEPGKMFSSLFSFFSHFPLWAAEPEQSLQLNHTDGISSKKFFFKKGEEKEMSRTTRHDQEKIPFSLFTLQQWTLSLK